MDGERDGDAGFGAEISESRVIGSEWKMGRREAGEGRGGGGGLVEERK